jgi:hypothetical protein
MSAGNHGRGGGDRADRQAAHLTRHLNQRHPDTVLFLARHAGGQIEATAAELLAVTEAGVTVATDASIEPVHIAFDEAASARGDVRSRLRRLLEVTRAATPDCPLTSSDRDMRPSPPGQGAGSRCVGDVAAATSLTEVHVRSYLTSGEQPVAPSDGPERHP